MKMNIFGQRVRESQNERERERGREGKRERQRERESKKERKNKRLTIDVTTLENTEDYVPFYKEKHVIY